jgi:hypothetical protein
MISESEYYDIMILAMPRAAGSVIQVEEHLRYFCQTLRQMNHHDSFVIKTEVREAESVYKLHSMVNKNNLQHIGSVSSGQQRKVHR